MFWKFSNDTFQWLNDCYSQGIDIETKNGINSLTRCAKACFKNQNCNSFTFALSTCSLKNISSWNSLDDTKNSICGLIPNRIPNAICQWQTSEDGSYQWADNCLINYFSGCEAQQVGFLNPCNSTRTCAEACLANPNCNYFYFRNDGSYNRFGNYDCVLHKFPSLFIQVDKYYYQNSGFIVARRFNIDFIPNYCVNYYTVN